MPLNKETEPNLSNGNIVNKLTNFILEKKTLYLFMYLFIKENVLINIITNIKLILLSQFLIGLIWFPFKIKIQSLFNFLIILYIHIF